MSRTAHRRPLQLTSLVALFALCATVATGCLDAKFDTKLEQDGSGTMRIEVVLNPAISEMFSQFGGDEGSGGDVSMSSSEMEVPPELEGIVTVEEISGDEGMGAVITIDFDSPQQLSEAWEVLSESSDTGDAGAPTITKEGEGWRFAADFTGAVDTGGTSAMTEEEQMGAAFGEMFSELAPPTIEVTLDMPGDIVEADDAAEVDGSSARWSSKDGELGEIFAVSGTGGGFPVVPVLAGGLVLAALAVGAGLLLARQGGASKAAVAAAPSMGYQSPAGYPPQGGPDPYQPDVHHPYAAAQPGVQQAPAPFDAHQGTQAPYVAPAPAMPEGWYRDPSGQAAQRWWDGTAWTGYTQ